MPTPDDQQILRMDGWPGGVNNRVRETEQSVLRDGEAIPSSQFLRKALNVDFTAEGHPLRRQGYQQITAGYAHSAWGCDALNIFAVVIDGQLMVGRKPDEATTIATVNKYNAVEYAWLNDSIYYSNGIQLGRITFDLQHRPWGVPVPPQPAVVGPAAENPNGWSDTRQVAVTYTDTWDTEGGASEPVLVGADGAFSVTVPMPLPPDIKSTNIYVSQPNSEILYLVESLIASPTATIHPQNIGKGRELETLNMYPPKPGQIVREMAGRLFIARNNKIIFTEPLKYHLTRPSQGIFMFSDYITMLEPSTDGLYVGTKHGVVFLQGTDPFDVRQVHVSPYAPIERAVTRVPGEKFGVSIDELPVWWGTDGVMVVGLPQGQLRQLTRDRLAVSAFQAGAVSLREREGMSHIVSSLRRGDGMNPMGASDSVVAEVRQNNIVLNS